MGRQVQQVVQHVVAVGEGAGLGGQGVRDLVAGGESRLQRGRPPDGAVQRDRGEQRAVAPISAVARGLIALA
ncbi:hypothetical protein [Streptomyces sp. NPDC001450]